MFLLQIIIVISIMIVILSYFQLNCNRNRENFIVASDLCAFSGVFSWTLDTREGRSLHVYFLF